MKRLSSEQLTFLLSLIAYLNEYREASVGQLAEYFQYPEKYVRELIPQLTTFGVPGSSGSYLHDNLFNIDWDAFEEDDLVFLTLPEGVGDVPRFSAAEATALIMGLQHLRNVPELNQPALIDELISKLAQGSAGPVRPPIILADEPTPELEILRKAMTEQLKVSFDYVTANGPRKNRIVAPLGLSSNNTVWYLRAWDLTIDDERIFRIDRMHNIVLSQEQSGIPAREEQPAHLFDLAKDGLHTVLLRAGDNAQALLKGFQAIHTRDNHYEIQVSHPHTIKRTIAANAGAVLLESPNHMRAQVHQWAATALAQYD